MPVQNALADVDADSSFWASNQPGFRFSTALPGSPKFFADVEAHRYALEPHIPEVVHFENWAEKDVLEVGCGIATDGLRFARAGARYTGLDMTEPALALARRRFKLADSEGSFVLAPATELPFPDDSFDLVYSHGVIHHIADTEGAVAEFRRVLRPGGTALVMLYHRDSLNYYVNIMLLRRTLAVALLLPGAPRMVARLTGEDPILVKAHRELLRAHGLRYVRDSELFLSHNTDGPGNPLSKAYSRRQATQLFRDFEEINFETRFLNLRVWPGGDRLAGTALARRLERRFGWHLYVRACKPTV